MPPSRRFGPPRARLVLVACALLALGACGDGPAPGPQAATPAVGARAPAVSGLPPGPAIVVFYRGHWWSYCRKQLGELQARLGLVRAKGASLVAISVDSDAEREGLRAKLGLTFPLRKDDGLALARAYGVVEGTTPHPRPATFVLAADRTVLFAHVGRNAADRPALTDVLAALRP